MTELDVPDSEVPDGPSSAASVRVTVVGAGVAGLTCAVELAERGVTVEVLDRGASLGATACSWFAGGMLAPWCELESAEPLITRLGVESIAWWKQHFPAMQVNGSLVVAHARDAGDLGQFAKRTERYEWLQGEVLGEREPTLAGRFEQALYFKDEAHLDPRAALKALAGRLGELGVPIRFGVDARSVLSRDELAADARSESKAPATAANSFRRDMPIGSQTDSTGTYKRPEKRASDHRWTDRRIIDCTGLAARDVLTDLRGVKGEMLLLRLRDLQLSRPVRLLHPRIPVYIVPRGDGLFMVGATSLESDQPTRISVRSMLELLSAAYALHPSFGEAEIVEIGTGVRPAFPDNLPRITRRGNVISVNGLYRHGFLLAPALARMTAEVVLHDRHFAEVTPDEDPRQWRMA